MAKLQRIENVLLFLTLLFLPTQLGKHFWLEFSFIYSLPIDYLSPTLYFWDLLVICLCIIFILRGSYINRVALNLFFLFILTQTASLLSSFASIGVGLVRLEQYAVAGLFGVYIASSKNPSVKSIIFWGLGLSIIGEGILAIFQFLKNGTLGFWILGERTFSISTPGIAKFDFYGVQFLRPYATFPHPNVLAGFLIITALLLSLWKNRQWLTRLVIFTVGLTVLLTVSRSAIVAGFVSAMILLKNKGRIILLVVTVILLPVLYTRFSSVLNYDNLALTRREELFSVALTLWSKSPILGVGLNNFIPTASDLLLSGPSRFLQPVHNIFLLALSETGIIGFLGLISLLVYPIFKIFKQKNLLIIWIVIIFLGMFDHYFLTLPQGYRLLFLVWGLSFRITDR